MTRSTSAARKARNACMWCARWFLEISIALVITGLVAAMLFGGGCTPRIPVDTNGDSKPDAEMSITELEAWQARDKAATEAAAKKVKRDAERAIKATDAANVQAIDEIKADAEDQIGDMALNFQAREDTRSAAIEDLERQADIVTGILNNPTLKSVAGTVPFGGEILTAIGGIGALVFGHRAGKKSGLQQGSQTGESKGWDDGYAAGLAAGKQQGVSEGRDIGWQERAEHQAEIDKTYEEALNRAGKVAA